MNIEKNIKSGAAVAVAIAASTSLVGNITVANAESNVNKTGIVNTSALNVRKGPGTNNSIITKIYKNDKVTILDSSQGWYKVKLTNGKTGWVSDDYIKVSSNSSSTSSSSNTGKTGTVTTDVLNVRSGAGTKYSKISSLKKGDKITIQETKSGWHKFKMSNGKTGWVSGDYIKVSSSSSSTSSDNSTSSSSNKGKTGTVTTDVLNVRSGAGTKYSKISSLRKGDKITIQETKNGWHKFKMSNGKTGWVSSEYIKVSSSSSSSSSSSQSSIKNKIGVVNTSSLNVRKGAGTNYSVIGSVKSGQKVGILSSKNGWYNVLLPNGSKGWVSGKYLNLIDGDPNSVVQKPSASSSIAKKAVDLAKKQIGKPYEWGAEGPNSFDCSGLTYYVYKQNGVTLPRSSTSQATAGKSVSKSSLKEGDLVFFNTNGKGISHVGIYIGDGKMVHSTKPGQPVKIDSINSSYYKARYVTARRIAD